MRAVVVAVVALVAAAEAPDVIPRGTPHRPPKTHDDDAAGQRRASGVWPWSGSHASDDDDDDDDDADYDYDYDYADDDDDDDDDPYDDDYVDDDEWDPADDDDWRTALAHLSRTQKFLIAWGSLAGVGFGVGCFYLLIAARCCDSFVYRARGYRRTGGRVGFDGEFEAFDEDGDEYPGALEDDDGLEMMTAKRA